MSDAYFALIIAEKIEIPTLRCVYLPNNNYAYVAPDVDCFQAAMKALRKNIKRYCMVYCDDAKKVRQGTVKATKGKFEFGRQDEVFVPIGSDGFPMADATMVTRKEGAGTGEYEIVQNAIDLALQRYGLPMSSDAFKAAVTG
jgi:hypothetical protein